MFSTKKWLVVLAILLPYSPTSAQEVDGDQLGAWYMYFFNKPIGDAGFGVQGDLQYRSWNAGGDLEQLLLRGGATYRPEEVNALFTLGYANITTGAFGDSDAVTGENRIYQEVLLPHRLSDRVLLTHRFRYEQRFVEDQDFRTRYRYNLFVNVLLNGDEMAKKIFYVALYNELFINGQRGIGAGRQVQFFDRNRTYLGLGYGLRDNLRVQAGWMQQTTVTWAKGQTQLSLHHTF